MDEIERIKHENRMMRLLLDSTEFALEWFFDTFDDAKYFQCDCSESGGYMEWDTNAFIHTERCSSGMDDSLEALRDQIRAVLGKSPLPTIPGRSVS